ncbi:MAG: hypothetical protein SAJ12_07980 [Jaaginema sp. PMC 1079.18]|nr:hypothetical protein [Jaaginema sp. PMC 1080.18]MEC4850936.1 hypothetical protein [Jaaginema sp. PMC 1079.18]MEC4865746.1 hypothetical protein [Jaaginema sp. PMC 1078.18]
MSYCINLSLILAVVGIITPGLFPLEAIAQTPIQVIDHESLPENVEAFLGEIITVRGSVIRVLEDGNFWIRGEPLVTGKNILVINNTGSPMPERRNQYTNLQITGEVQRLNLATAPENFGVDRELYLNYGDIPVIFAQSIDLSPSPGEVTQFPQWYYNRSISIEGRVADTLGQKFFTIAEGQLFGGSDLLAAIAHRGVDLPETNQKVLMVGYVRPFVASELTKQEDLTADLVRLQEYEEDYTNRPVFMVDRIYVLD